MEACLLPNEKQKGDRSTWESGEELGEVEGRKSISEVYFTKKIIFNEWKEMCKLHFFLK